MTKKFLAEWPIVKQTKNLLGNDGMDFNEIRYEGGR